MFADTSDLYQENIKDGKYMLNGEWKDILVVEEIIYVKGQSEPHVHKVQLTHRGPVLSHKYDKVAKEPIVDIGMNVSLVWTG